MVTRTAYTTINNKSIKLEHDEKSYVKIYDQPIEMPHFSDSKTDRLQHVIMMDFQAKLSMVMRAQAKQNKLSLPLPKSKYGVTIKVTTIRDKKELPILLTAKAIVDAINKEVIDNDADIYSLKVEINPVSARSRRAKSKPTDEIDLEVYDVVSMKSLIRFQGLNTYIVPKSKPVLAGGFDAEYFYPDRELYHTYVQETLNRKGFVVSAADAYSVKLNFTGAVQSKDIDNMAKTYLPILESMPSFKADNILSLELYKEHEDTHASVEIYVNCNSMQP